MISAVALLLACTAAPPAPAPAPADDPEVRVNAPPTEAELLTQGAPDPTPSYQTMLRLADGLGVGIAFCPAAATGRVRRVHGLSRDMVMRIGPKFMVEVSDDIPWLPIYDEIVAEERWSALLVQPGSTGAFVQLGSRMVQYTFPPGRAGEAVVCTAAENVARRVVRGTVAQLLEQESLMAHGCTEDGTAVAKDGTFVVDAHVPCPLWVETSAGRRSVPVRVGPGADKLIVDDLPLAADPLQNPDGTWTDAGRAALGKVVTMSRTEVKAQRALLDGIQAELAADSRALATLKRYRSHLNTWEKQANAIEQGLAGKLPL